MLRRIEIRRARATKKRSGGHAEARALDQAAIWKWTNDLPEATWVASVCGSSIGVVIFALGLLCFVLGEFLLGLWCLLIGLGLRRAARLEYHQFVGGRMLRKQQTGEFMRNSRMAVPKKAAIREFVDEYADKYRCDRLPVVDEGQLAGSLV